MDSSVETQNYDPIDNIDISKDDSSQDLEVNDVLTSETSEVPSNRVAKQSIEKTIEIYLLYLQKLIIENFIIFALSVAIIFAFSYPKIGAKASKIMDGNIRVIEFINNIIVFFISGMTLKVEELHSVIKYKYVAIFGLVCINVITTFLAFVTRELPFKTNEFTTGITIFCTVPTTLGVGVALTQASKGDTILSLFLTVVSNLLGILTIPLLLNMYLSSSGNASLDANKLAYKLSLTVLVPTVFGLLVRRFIKGVPDFTKKYKNELSMFSMANLMTIVWMSLSSSRKVIFQQDPGEVILVFIANIIIHCFYLLMNFLFMRYVWSSIPLKQAISIIIMASQKSSPVALSVIAVIAKGNSRGLLTIPCIIGQLTQIFIGSFIARKLAQLVDQEAAAKENEKIETSKEDSKQNSCEELIGVAEDGNQESTGFELVQIDEKVL